MRNLGDMLQFHIQQAAFVPVRHRVREADDLSEFTMRHLAAFRFERLGYCCIEIEFHGAEVCQKPCFKGETFSARPNARPGLEIY